MKTGENGESLRFLALLGRRLRFLLLVLAGWLSTLSPMSASVLDWSDPLITYTPGSLSATYTNVDSSGVDIQITILDPNSILGSFGGTATPAINNVLTGGQPVGQQENLFFFIQPNPVSEFIRVQVEFFLTGTSTDAAVQDVSFDVFDIDRNGNGIDEVRNFSSQNTVAGTGPDGPSSVTAVNPANVNVTGSGTTIVATGVNNIPNNSDQANITVDYTGVLLTEFAFDYGYASTASPAGSGVGLYNINFTLVPEAEPWVAVGALPGVALVLRRRRSA